MQPSHQMYFHQLELHHQQHHHQILQILHRSFEQTQYQQRVREVFEKNILPVFKNVQIIDASLSISDVHTTVMQKILSLTGKK